MTRGTPSPRRLGRNAHGLACVHIPVFEFEEQPGQT